MGHDQPTGTDVFTHAVASFDPTGHSVLLWTRLAHAGPASWVVAADAHFDQVVASGDARADLERDRTMIVDATGLEPATTYFYRFEVDGHRSPVGRTRTLPGAPTERFRLGLASCSRYSLAPLGVYRALAEREVDLVLHLGDYIYEDEGDKGARRHEPGHRAVTLDDYRQRMAQIRADPDCQALHLRHPMVAIVDDHDVADNCWTTGAKAHDDEEDGPYEDRAIAAATTRQEWLPQRLRDPSDPKKTWRSVPVGDLAELLLLDTRLSGRDQQAGDEGTKPLRDPDRSMLGDEQRAWLRDRLADTSRPWAVVASGVVVNEISLPMDPVGSAVNPAIPNGYALLDGMAIHDDQWDGYPAERERLVSFLAQRGEAGGRSVLLSADVHSSWAFEGPRDADGRPVAVEFTVPAVSSKPMGRSHLPGAWRLMNHSVQRLDHVPWANITRRGYSILDLTPGTATLEWWYTEPTYGDPGGHEWLGAVWATDHAGWPPRLHEASTTDEPTRPDRTEPPPDRPADLRSMRRSHYLRVASARGTALAAMALAAAALYRAARSQPRR